MKSHLLAFALLTGCVTFLPLSPLETASAADVAVAASAPNNNPVRLCLPPRIYAVVGDEMNVYFDNVMLTLNPRNYAVDVNCPRGRQQVERWTYCPAAGEEGDCDFEMIVRDQNNQIVAQAKTTLKVVPAAAGADRPITLLVIGDSLTHASVSTAHLLELCQRPGNPQLALVGSFHPVDPSGKNRHEGYGGWTAQRFATQYIDESKRGGGPAGGSPFVYPAADGSKALDFARYYKDQNGGRPVDFVMILLGCNDTFGANDENIESTIDTMLTHYDALVAAIRKASPAAKIGVMFTVPPAAAQDAFAVNYACGQTRWQYKRNQHRAVERLLERYDNREKENIFTVPSQTNLDCQNGFPAANAPWNSRTDAKTDRLSNGVHPSDSGYRQIGDSMYAWLKARLAETP